MARPLIDDALWALIEPLLPSRPDRHVQGAGRKPLPDRAVLTGIVFVLRTGIPWELLPQEMGCGCGMTCWRRLRAWQKAGVWERLHHVLLSHLRAADRLDLSRVIVDSSQVRALRGGEKNRSQPRGSAQSRQQASSAGRRPRHSAGDPAHRRQPQRHHPTETLGDPHARHSR